MEQIKIFYGETERNINYFLMSEVKKVIHLNTNILNDFLVITIVYTPLIED